MEVTDVTEHEDGSATYTFEVDGTTTITTIEGGTEVDALISVGLKTLLFCSALGLSTEDLWKMLDEKVEEHK